MSASEQPLANAPDRTGYKICGECKMRYVTPGDVYPKGKRKGEQQDRCLICRRLKTKKEFPQDLVLSKHERLSQKSTLKSPDVVEQWLARLTSEQESVLFHTKSIIGKLPQGTRRPDITRATHHIHWDDVEERLRDIYSLERLFNGFESLMGCYESEVNTVHPIGLIAVSLNNCAIRSEQPFKFSWMQDKEFKDSAVPGKSGAKSALIIALEAWLPSEKAWWNTATPSQRLKKCSLWEINIQPSASTMLIPYTEMDSCTFDLTRKTANLVPHHLHECLLWARKTYKGHRIEEPGQLLLPQGIPYAPQIQCKASADLLTVLAHAFHRHDKIEWRILYDSILSEMHKIKDAGNAQRAKFKELVEEERARSCNALKDNESASEQRSREDVMISSEVGSKKRPLSVFDEDKGSDDWEKSSLLLRPRKKYNGKSVEGWLNDRNDLP
ncbi:hypothetical protein COCVIDRAFT_27834 [Bipolaris victoriae FI3]|uniref:Uncharacterized protein n=1 Tax=Bipolaris victoriae (strain FI3) TaxID=930091 RepID=W7E5B5_BIPV3|nr:hypothetical protein COCVIDRAFT_27834 [Bipolaris victoriae FI3]